MEFDTICQLVQESHKNGESYEKIGKRLGISKASVRRIENGQRPGENMCKLLGVDPSKKLLSTRSRNKSLNELANWWGYKSWSAYETEMIRCNKDAGNIGRKNKAEIVAMCPD